MNQETLITAGVNTNTATFWPNSTTANTHNGETPWVPIRRTFEEKARIKIAKTMERQGCSILLATMLWQQEWEVCDVEEVLSI